ncbi:MAG: TerC family protein [Deltaproteobacteria bacterium]|nr:TerC family protein [Deltaproteobacteria bacterium]
MISIGTPTLWLGFTAFILFLLLLDLGILHRKVHAINMKEATITSILWVLLALLFNSFIGFEFGKQQSLEFLTGYVIELALSVDNLFVFLVIFSYFKLPSALQHRVLFWGIIGAQVMRVIFIAIGAALLAKFHWIIYVFGAFLVITGIKLYFQRESDFHPEKNWIVKIYKKLIPAVSEYHGSKFTIRIDGKRYATMLLLVLVVIEASDVLFAVDSIPAIFAVTKDPFIVYSSNIFAILGLRSFFFLLAGMMEKFHYLKVGLSLVLIFVGLKMLIADLIHIPIGVSLGVVASLIAGSVAISLAKPVTKGS